MAQHRNAYQEIDHLRPFSAVTKYSVPVDSAEQLPFLLRQAFREATSGAPGPAHLDLEGTSGNVVAEGEADLEVIIEEPLPASQPTGLSPKGKWYERQPGSSPQPGVR